MNHHFRYVTAACPCSPWSFGCSKVKDVVTKLWRDSEKFRASICRVVRFKIEC